MLCIALFLTMLVPMENVQAKEKNQQTLYKAQTHFLKTNKLNKNDIQQSFYYDINNDGKLEIVISAWNSQLAIDSISIIGIYSNEGKFLTSHRLKDSYNDDFSLLHVSRIHNPTYKNVIAAEYLGGVSGGSLIQVFIFKNNRLVPILLTEQSETSIILKDLNGDQNQEIIGFTPYGGKPFEGSYHTAPLHKFIYQWNKAKNKYTYTLELKE